MEVFVAAREREEVLALVEQLNRLEIYGRDAAYLASVQLPCEADQPAQASFLNEFRYMVPPAARDAAAKLIGLKSLQG